ncbi:hypothetical protein M885DRAFT_615280 [Pelagophyceae sp. CCMP2097]|nr:hypothetical protein M885DRAFT_615280 [Pelagophyceae sp. CCMP2097]
MARVLAPRSGMSEIDMCAYQDLDSCGVDTATESWEQALRDVSDSAQGLFLGAGADEYDDASAAALREAEASGRAVLMAARAAVAAAGSAQRARQPLEAHAPPVAERVVGFFPDSPWPSMSEGFGADADADAEDAPPAAAPGDESWIWAGASPAKLSPSGESESDWSWPTALTAGPDDHLLGGFTVALGGATLALGGAVALGGALPLALGGALLGGALWGSNGAEAAIDGDDDAAANAHAAQVLDASVKACRLAAQRRDRREFGEAADALQGYVEARLFVCGVGCLYEATGPADKLGPADSAQDNVLSPARMRLCRETDGDLVLAFDVKGLTDGGSSDEDDKGLQKAPRRNVRVVRVRRCTVSRRSGDCDLDIFDAAAQVHHRARFPSAAHREALLIALATCRANEAAKARVARTMFDDEEFLAGDVDFGGARGRASSAAAAADDAKAEVDAEAPADADAAPADGDLDDESAVRDALGVATVDCCFAAEPPRRLDVAWRVWLPPCDVATPKWTKLRVTTHCGASYDLTAGARADAAPLPGATRGGQALVALPHGDDFPRPPAGPWAQRAAAAAAAGAGASALCLHAASAVDRPAAALVVIASAALTALSIWRAGHDEAPQRPFVDLIIAPHVAASPPARKKREISWPEPAASPAGVGPAGFSGRWVVDETRSDAPCDHLRAIGVPWAFRIALARSANVKHIAYHATGSEPAHWVEESVTSLVTKVQRLELDGRAQAETHPLDGSTVRMWTALGARPANAPPPPRTGPRQPHAVQTRAHAAHVGAGGIVSVFLYERDGAVATITRTLEDGARTYRVHNQLLRTDGELIVTNTYFRRDAD